MEPGNVARTERDQSFAHPNGKEEPDHSANDRDDKTFDQQFLDNFAASRSDCGVNGELSRAGSAARGKQIGQVGAGDQQHEADGAEKDEQRRADVANNGADEARKGDVTALVGLRILQREP